MNPPDFQLLPPKAASSCDAVFPAAFSAVGRLPRPGRTEAIVQPVDILVLQVRRALNTFNRIRVVQREGGGVKGLTHVALVLFKQECLRRSAHQASVWGILARRRRLGPSPRPSSAYFTSLRDRSTCQNAAFLGCQDKEMLYDGVQGGENARREF